ncbi:hypothetical protein [Allorhizobium ampelinum]|uniref:hypothetical protein n=1 Tax=Allorhizobium ampelinum TaxID=3025782 RepID=UPI00031D248B|nr:hypothetical protein [Allorhizobium ampelinum]
MLLASDADLQLDGSDRCGLIANGCPPITAKLNFEFCSIVEIWSKLGRDDDSGRIPAVTFFPVLRLASH